MSSGIKSHQTKIYHGDGESPEVFTKIDEVFSVGPVGGAKGLIDMSNQDTSNMMDYKLKDLADGKQITCEANEIPGNTSQNLVRTAYDNGDEDNWKVIYRDGTYEIFTAIVLDYETDASALDDRVIFRWILKIISTIARTTA